MLPRRTLLASALLGSCARRGLPQIAVVPKATAHLFFVSIHGGVDRAAKEFGMEVPGTVRTKRLTIFKRTV